MTVKELKDILAKHPDDMDIYIDLVTDEGFTDSNIWTSHVRDLFLSEDGCTERVKDGKITQRACEITSGAKKCLIL